MTLAALLCLAVLVGWTIRGIAPSVPKGIDPALWIDAWRKRQ